MGRRNHRRGFGERNEDEKKGQRATYPNGPHLAHRSQLPPAGHNSASTQLSTFEGKSKYLNKFPSRSQHPYLRTNYNDHHHVFLLKSQSVKTNLLYHLNQALTEIERWNIEEKFRGGVDDMDWQPENEVVIPQTDKDAVYSYGNVLPPPTSSSSGYEYLESAREYKISAGEKTSHVVKAKANELGSNFPIAIRCGFIPSYAPRTPAALI
jgi:hypothetical protein